MRHSTAVALFLAVLIPPGCSTPPPPARAAGGSGMSDVERERVRRFWETFREARDHATGGRCVEAIPRFEAALALSPDHPDSLYSLAGCLVEVGRFDEAVRLYRRLVEVTPDRSPRAHAQIGDVYSRLDPGAPTDMNLALEALRGQQQLNPEESGPYLSIGEAEFLRGGDVEARAHLQAALGLNPSSVDGHYLLGLLLFERGEPAAAAAEFASAVKLGKPKLPPRGVAQEGDTRAAPPPLSGTALAARHYLGWCHERAPGLPADLTADLTADPPPAAPAAPAAPASIAPRLDTLAGFAGSAPRALVALGTDTLAVADEVAGLRLYRRQGQGWRDASPAAGLAPSPGGIGVIAGDVDRDGDPDVYLLRGGWHGRQANVLYRNDGGHFTDVTATSGLGGERGTARALLADLDGDGDLDLIEAGGGPEPLLAFRNQDGRFTPYPAFPAATSAWPATWVGAADYDGDGKLDLLVTYWRAAPRLLHNDGDGVFADQTTAAGLATAPADLHTAAFADLDGDQRPEVLIAPWRPYDGTIERRPAGACRLWRNAGGRFEDASAGLGLADTAGTMDIVVLDANGDGRPDLFLANGGPRFDAREASWLLVNQGGLRFRRSEIPAAGRLPINTIAAAALGDDLAVIAGGWYPRSGREVRLLSSFAAGLTF